jgi:phosphoglycolate phosphatase
MNVLVIDLDGTIVDTLDDIALALVPVMEANGLASLSPAAVRPLIGDGLAVLVERAFALRDASPTSADLAAYAASYDRQSGRTARLSEGAREALDAARAAGWALVVCTNKNEAPARALLAKLGLIDRFAAICGGDTFPQRKPHPAHVLRSIEAAGGDPGGSVMVGDLHHDLDAARAGGVASIWAAWGYGRPEIAPRANATAHHWAELPPLAARLTGR